MAQHSDIVMLQMVYRIDAEARTLERFADLRIDRARVEAHLGHSIEAATEEEHTGLVTFLETAEARKREGKPIPLLKPASVTSPEPGTR